MTAAAAGGGEVGFCLDTCHANSAGIELADAVDRIKAITGRIDLVHCNNSRDEFGSGRDRHANIDAGTIDPAVLLGVVRAAGAPAICETPDEDGGLAADVSWLQEHLRRPQPQQRSSRSREPVRRPGPGRRRPGRRTAGTHHVPFGEKDVPHHVGGEQAYGEEPGQRARRNTSSLLMPW